MVIRLVHTRDALADVDRDDRWRDKLGSAIESVGVL